MKGAVTLVFLLFLVLPSGADPAKDGVVVELPRPNSGTFSFEQARARKGEILMNQPSGKLPGWKNPYSGFCLHIDKEDRISAYNPFGLVPKESKGSDLTIAAVKKMMSRMLGGGNPSGILVTSEVRLKESKKFKSLLKELFQPGIQIFYLKETEKGAEKK